MAVLPPALDLIGKLEFFQLEVPGPLGRPGLNSESDFEVLPTARAWVSGMKMGMCKMR